MNKTRLLLLSLLVIMLLSACKPYESDNVNRGDEGSASEAVGSDDDQADDREEAPNSGDDEGDRVEVAGDGLNDLPPGHRRQLTRLSDEYDISIDDLLMMYNDGMSIGQIKNEVRGNNPGNDDEDDDQDEDDDDDVIVLPVSSIEDLPPGHQRQLNRLAEEYDVTVDDLLAMVNDGMSIGEIKQEVTGVVDDDSDDETEENNDGDADEDGND